ncbi:hypothetical protein BJD46_gp70 [Mycobacterium phage Bactobuster]|uniref:Uncharacterized protein n=1 Tax=Mycobacterium phage Bactobuster TaxID=1784956 RepID=A0A127KPK8_9CAUD|nr:hypothetical protein BJD46_gp70 [Mycobacterium phage Bactobuster]AMO44038.1 hypothetical protein SEA_BACTOBUSTER_70 [Mycobacterium phage Bactobuster]
MFEVGDEVVDKLLHEEGFAAIGIVKDLVLLNYNACAVVEWPDGQVENVPLNELQAVSETEKEL